MRWPLLAALVGMLWIVAVCWWDFRHYDPDPEHCEPFNQMRESELPARCLRYFREERRSKR